MARSHFHVDRPGVSETFRSAGMQGALMDVTSSQAARANALAAGHHVDHHPLTGEPYAPNVYVGRDTALGFVNAVGREGALDNAIYHTLDAINH